MDTCENKAVLYVPTYSFQNESNQGTTTDVLNDTEPSTFMDAFDETKIG